jgi:hypothetical protein
MPKPIRKIKETVETETSAYAEIEEIVWRPQAREIQVTTGFYESKETWEAGEPPLEKALYQFSVDEYVAMVAKKSAVDFLAEVHTACAVKDSV